MASFLEYLKQNAGTRSFQGTIKTFLLWLLFFAVVVGVYLNVIGLIEDQAAGRFATHETVRQFSASDLRNLGGLQANVEPGAGTNTTPTQEFPDLPNVVTIRIN